MVMLSEVSIPSEGVIHSGVVTTAYIGDKELGKGKLYISDE